MSDPIDEPRADDRRAFLGLTLLGAGLGAAGAAGAATDDPDPKIQIIGLHPAGAPAAAQGYSPGVGARGTKVVFVSGQGPEDMNADMEKQIRQTMDRIGLVLRAGGATFKDVVMIRAYFVDITRDLPIYRAVRKDYLSEPYPASTAIGVTSLAVPELRVEIEAIAIV